MIVFARWADPVAEGAPAGGMSVGIPIGDTARRCQRRASARRLVPAPRLHRRERRRNRQDHLGAAAVGLATSVARLASPAALCQTPRARDASRPGRVEARSPREFAVKNTTAATTRTMRSAARAGTIARATCSPRAGRLKPRDPAHVPHRALRIGEGGFRPGLPGEAPRPLDRPWARDRVHQDQRGASTAGCARRTSGSCSTITRARSASMTAFP